MLVNDIIEINADRVRQDREKMEECIRKKKNNDEKLVVLKLVNKGKNLDMLKNIPYVDFLDMAVTFRKIISLSDEGMMSTLVTYDDMRDMNMDLEMMYKNALENTKRIFPVVKGNVCDIIKSVYLDACKRGEYNVEQLLDMTEAYAPEEQLYVLTNTRGLNGATSILYDGVLKECAEMVQDDVYFMPSSIHEFMFIKAGAGFDGEYLKEIVTTANQEVVSSVEYLSGNIYRYNRTEDSIVQV
jgi:hypothetical protein